MERLEEEAACSPGLPPHRQQELRRLRRQADTAVQAVQALQAELRELRSACAATHSSVESLQAVLQPLQEQPPSTASEAEATQRLPHTAPPGGTSVEDHRTRVSRLRARVSLLRAISRQSPTKAAAREARREWRQELQGRRKQRDEAEVKANESRDAAAKASQQLASLVEIMWPGEEAAGRAAGALLRRLLRGEDHRLDEESARSELGLPTAEADGVLERLQRLGLLHVDGQVVALSLPS